MACVLAVLDFVDQRLRMLDAHADGEGLRLEPRASHGEQLEHVARAVTRGEHDRGGLDFLAARQSARPRIRSRSR